MFTFPFIIMVCATTATFTIVYYHHHAGKLVTLIIFGWYHFYIYDPSRSVRIFTWPVLSL